MHKKTIIDFRDLGQRYCFENPVCELKADTLSDVGKVLKIVESYQREGYYVVGYLSYEAAAYFDSKLETHTKPLFDGLFAYFSVHTEVRKEAFPIHYEGGEMPEQWRETTSQALYQEAIDAIRGQIRQGNTYQVNYTVQLRQVLPDDALAIYERLVVEQAAGYNAYIAHDDVKVLSISPELFFKTEEGRLITRPMKGTVARGLGFEEDQAKAAWLKADSKNRAENMMIVDLLRNDMGKLCQTGSVQVTKLCDVEQYSTVWQMTSTIVGHLREGQGLEAILKALYPCGSITGAPKIATMALIKQLEPQARGVYCGTIGLCLPDGNMIFNVPIRTIQLQGQEANYGVGGGITWDSNWQDEYKEVTQKASVLYRKTPNFDLLTTAKLSSGRISFLAEHLQRLQEASSYFAYPFKGDELMDKLTSLCREHSQGDYRLKTILKKSGDFEFEVDTLGSLSRDFLRATIQVREGEFRKSPFTYFKTSYRPHLKESEQEIIYIDDEGRLLETSIANIIIEKDGRSYTPPLTLGILGGIYRSHLIKMNQLEEKILTLADLREADRVCACNAVRGIYELDLTGSFPKDVYGDVLDAETRCLHYHSELDVIALRCFACRRYYPCYHCHDKYEDHAYLAYPSQLDHPIVLCGVCHQEMTVGDYRAGEGHCPNCQVSFNPGCYRHEDIYFKD